MPRELRETSQFKSDKKRVQRSGRHDREKMRDVVRELMHDRPLHGGQSMWFSDMVFARDMHRKERAIYEQAD